MLSWAEKLDLPILGEPWLPQVLLAVGAALLAHLVARFLLRRVHRLTARTSNVWDDALVQAARRPLPVAIWVVGISVAAGVMGRHSDLELFEYAKPLRHAGVIFCIAWFLFRFIGGVTAGLVARGAAGNGAVDRTTVDALGKLARLSVAVVAALVVLETLGFSVSGVLAFGGIGGIAIGFAARDLLANFFGGLTIYMDRPFVVGEWIRSPDRDIEGTVEYISWRHTRIRGFNKNPIYVPNAVFTTIVVENPSRMTNRRIHETIGIRYDDLPKMAPIVAEVKAMLQGHEEIDTTQTLIVNFNAFADSSVNFFVYTFTRTTQWVRYHEVKQDVLLKIAAIIERHGAEIAFPTRTLHLVSPEGAGLEPAAA